MNERPELERQGNERQGKRPANPVDPARKPLDPTGLKRLHRGWRRQTDGRVALILDGVANPFNLGTIVRHAAAYKVEQAWLVGPEEAFGHPRFHKTAMGTERFVPWNVVATPGEALAQARAAGFRPIGIELNAAAVPLFATDLSDGVALVLGHEERGLSRAMLDGCDGFAYVPQVGKVGSLNVAAATAIALYEARRQEWTRPQPPGPHT